MCAAWYSMVNSPTCVSDLLISSSWSNASRMANISSDDAVSLLKTYLQQYLNGTVHTIVELSARFLYNSSVAEPGLQGATSFGQSRSWNRNAMWLRLRQEY
jgi:hypothetical protein